MMKLLCWLGLHNWMRWFVESKKRFEHCRGWKELSKMDEIHLHNGRVCRWCKKEQYTVLNWTSITYKNVIK